MSDQTTDLSRRTMLRGAARRARRRLRGLAPAPAAAGGQQGQGGATVAAADVPVGGGTILADAKVVVTQPEKGTFKAFTAVCTHQGCTVTKVLGGKIVCPCHGSTFSITDGSPQGGPAQSALAEKKVSVEGDQISVS